MESTDHHLKEIQKEKLLGTLWPNSEFPGQGENIASSQKETILILWKYNQDNTKASSFYIKELMALEYDISEVKGTGFKTKNHLPSKTEYNTLREKKWSFNYIENFQVFLMKRPDLNRKFDFQTQE